MTDQVKTLEAKPEDELAETKTEQIRDRRVYMPRTDIYETKDELVLVMDVPGAAEQSVEVSLEKNVLTITARATINAALRSRMKSIRTALKLK
jgi:HSP20 family molecular chaperone IbpA